MRFKKSYILPSLLLPVYAAEYYKSVDEAVKVHSDEVMWKPKLYTFQGGLLMAIQFLKCKACSKAQRSDRLLCLSCGANIQTGVHPNTKIEEPLDSAPSAPHPQQHFSGSLLPKNNTQWAIIWVIVVAVLLSVFSGFLIYMEASMMFVAPGERPSTLFVVITFTIGWAAATYFMTRKTKSVSKVFSRGFLIGAAEWFAMIPVGVVFSGKLVGGLVATQPQSGAALVGATIGGGIFSFLTGGVAIFMTVLCLIGFAVSYFIGREMKPEATVPTKKCPDCAEMIQAGARKCRFCGCELPEVPSAPTSSTGTKYAIPVA